MTNFSFLIILLVTTLLTPSSAFPLGYRPIPTTYTKNQPKTCLAIAIQGGGSKGAFQAGAIESLVTQLPQNETKYKSITGVSIGAINSFGISVQKPSTSNISEFLSSIWHKFAVGQVLVSWDFGVIQGVMLHSSLFNYKLSEYMISHYEEQYPNLQRRLTVGAVNLRNGKFQLFNSTIGFQRMALAIQASSSIPFFLPPTKIQNQYYIDGGSVYNVLPSQAVDQCVDMGYSVENTKVDVLMTHPFNITWKDMRFDKDGGVFNMLSRVRQIRSHYHTVFEVLYSMWEYPKAKWRYLVRPDSELDEGINPVDFSQDHINKIYQQGVGIGKEAVDMGEGASFNKFLEGEGKVNIFGAFKDDINESNRIKFIRNKVVYI